MSKFLDEIGVAHLWNNIKTYFQEEYGNSWGGGVADIPSGIVCAWAGSEDGIPSGWHLCDGTNGTPNLKGRFVLGSSSSYAVGSKGGSASVTLTLDQMPFHTHTYDFYKNSGSYTVVPSSSAGGSTVSSRETSAAGSNSPHPNMPPYYTLCYIMKL